MIQISITTYKSFLLPQRRTCTWTLIGVCLPVKSDIFNSNLQQFNLLFLRHKFSLKYQLLLSQQLFISSQLLLIHLQLFKNIIHIPSRLTIIMWFLQHRNSSHVLFIKTSQLIDLLTQVTNFNLQQLNPLLIIDKLILQAMAVHTCMSTPL